MGKTISVDPQALNEASKRLAEYADSYAMISKQLFDRAETMGAAYESEDNLAFVAQIHGLTDDLKAMSDKMKQASETLAMQSKRYSDRSESNVITAKKLAN